MTLTASAGDVRTWTLRFDGARPTTMNEYRKMHHHVWRRVDTVTRSTFAWLAKKERIPPLARIAVVVQPLHANARSPQDVAACAPAAKAAIDGLVDAGVIPDDGPNFVVSVLFLQPHVAGVDGMQLTIAELAAPQEA